jgi:predicted nucleic acid-binding protein
VAALVDTNLLVYRFDPRFPDKQTTATRILRDGLPNATCLVPHQAILEFVAVVTRPLQGGAPLLSEADAWREAEDLLTIGTVLYPTEKVVRTALRGAALYRLSWFDAHLWAFAEAFGLSELLSEDFQHGRLFGTVRIVNPFLLPST